MKMHDGEADIDAGLVRRLVAAQFPSLAGLPVSAVQPAGTVNAIYRLGDRLCARLPRVRSWAQDLDEEWDWLPKLAPQLSLRVPEPVAKGRPGSGYPFSWAIYRWIDGQPYADEVVGDERRAARELAQFVTELRRIDPAGAPRGGAGATAPARCRHPRGHRLGARRHRQRCGHGRLVPGTRSAGLGRNAGVDSRRPAAA